MFVVLYLLGWCLMAGFFPPPAPTASAEEIAAFYAGNTGLIRAGLLIAMVSCTFYLPWVAVISQQMLRMSGVSPVLAQTQALSGVAGMLIFLLPIMIWLTATFRPERDPQLILLVNDLGWLLFTITFAPFVSQNFALALAILGDQSPQRVFPRWVASYSIWTCLSFVPVVLIIYFKRGPFAWTGAIGLWIPLILFTIWVFVMVALLLRAIRAETGEGQRVERPASSLAGRSVA